MPLPWFVGFGVAGGAMIAKISKDIREEIEDINQEAEDLVYDSTNAANKSRKACSEAITDLGNQKSYILDHSIKPFVKVFEKLHNVELTEFTAINELKSFQIDEHSFEDLEELKEISMTEWVLGGVAGLLLEGIPMTILSAAKTSANRDIAYSNLARAKEIEERMKTDRLLCNGIRMRATMFQRLLLKLNAVFEPFVNMLEQTIVEYGTDFSQYTPQQKAVVASCLSIVSAIKAVLDTPILTADGNLTKESNLIVAPTQEVIEKYK